jgi:hypothetical protein
LEEVKALARKYAMTSKKTTNEKPVSLNPLNLKEALDGLLKVKPKDKPEKKPRKKIKKSSD